MKACWILLGIIVAVLFLVYPAPVRAQICYPSRSMSQWRCISGTQICDDWYSEARFGSQYCGEHSATDIPPNDAHTLCVNECQGPYGGVCTPNTCLHYSGVGTICDLQANLLVPCNPAPSCQTQYPQYINCDDSSGICTTYNGHYLGCWGPGPTSGPSPTSSPGPTPPLCGNGVCDPGEDCNNCPVDCGVCPTSTPTPTPTATETPAPTPTETSTPTPTPAAATVRVRAKQVSASDTSCAAVAASTTYVYPTSFDLSPVVPPGLQTQTDSNFVIWNNVPSGYPYTLTPNAPVSYSLVRACWDRTVTLPATGEGLAVSVGSGGETLTWELGYLLGSAWVQTGGADVYASGTLTSFIPVGITPRVFNLNGSGGTPGVVTYGTSYDFDSDTSSQGNTLVSSKNWLANETYAKFDFYDTFYHKFGAPVTTDNGFFPNLAAVGKPPSRATRYYIVGDMTTTGNWTIGDGERIIFLVNGNLTIGGNVNITGPNRTGFVSFIVKGNITVAPSVGGAYNSTTPNIEGIYITSPGGTFHTGTSGAGTERLVGRGMFIAGSFALERDLDSVGHNIDYSAELFTYNPQLLVTMPDEMRDTSFIWQEVAP